jgi:hypothetical protein
VAHVSESYATEGKKALIFVKAQHLRRVTTKALIGIRIGGGLPTVPHTP